MKEIRNTEDNGREYKHKYGKLTESNIFILETKYYMIDLEY